MLNKTYETDDIMLNYFEVENNKKPLVMLHAQGVCGLSYDNVFKLLSSKYHIFSIDCYGHGYSLHCKEKYDIKSIGEAIIQFITEVIGLKVYIVGHSSGGLLAAYIAAYSNVCEKLFLEDPPLFSSQGERRYKTFNYIDLSTICNNYIINNLNDDFVLYYFSNQQAWSFFPDKSRDKIKNKLVNMAKKYRRKYPDRDLKVPFWPKSALSAFKGMNQYDPQFGVTFYDNSFHANLSHEEILDKIECETILMKAKTNYNDGNILLAAMSEEDINRACLIIKNGTLVRFDCGHGIHIEKKKQFVRCLIDNSEK